MVRTDRHQFISCGIFINCKKFISVLLLLLLFIVFELSRTFLVMSSHANGPFLQRDFSRGLAVHIYLFTGTQTTVKFSNPFPIRVSSKAKDRFVLAEFIFISILGKENYGTFPSIPRVAPGWYIFLCFLKNTSVWSKWILVA